MTTTVKIVYVDPTGEVRMSPTGWPEEKELKGITGHITMAENQAALQKAKEESIPFEDRSAIMKRLLHYRDLPPGFYTIEPIQVELIDQYLDNTTLKWLDIDITEHVNVSLTRGIRTIARIVTEEEKPAEDETQDELWRDLFSYMTIHGALARPEDHFVIKRSLPEPPKP